MDKTLGAVRESYSLKSQRANWLKALHTLELCKIGKREERKIGEAGITLISLVVTVIVLIILAATTISVFIRPKWNFNTGRIW